MTPRFSLLACHERLLVYVVPCGPRIFKSSFIDQTRKTVYFADIIDRSLVDAWIQLYITSLAGMVRIVLTDLLLLLDLSGPLSASFLLGLALLQEGLGDQNLVVGGNGTAHSFSD